MSAELLAQKRAALADPDSGAHRTAGSKDKTAVGAGGAEAKSIAVNMAGNEDTANGSADSAVSSTAAGAAPGTAANGIAGHSPAPRSAFVGKAGMVAQGGNTAVGREDGGSLIQDGSTSGRGGRQGKSTLPFEQLCLTFKHGAPATRTSVAMLHLHDAPACPAVLISLCAMIELQSGFPPDTQRHLMMRQCVSTWPWHDPLASDRMFQHMTASRSVLQSGTAWTCPAGTPQRSSGRAQLESRSCTSST